MSAQSGFNNRRRRNRQVHGGHDASDERWLLTYSDMITLLMALFIVMWAISSVNTTKFEALKHSLSDAFKPLTGGDPSLLEGQPALLEDRQSLNVQIQPVSPAEAVEQSFRQALSQASQVEAESLRRLQREIEEYAKTHGFADRIDTTIDERGLVIRLLTDEVLFDTGRAVIKAPSFGILSRISALLSGPTIPNPIRVEGNTDSVPISTARYPSNWELSTARATAVLQYLLAHGVKPSRLSATGYADQHPIASNATAQGRAANRRVDIVVLRRFPTTPEGAAAK